MEKRGRLILLLALILIFVLPLMIAQEDEGPESGSSAGQAQFQYQQQVEDTIQNGGSTNTQGQVVNIDNVGPILSGSVSGEVSQQGGTVFIENLQDGRLDGGAHIEGGHNVQVGSDGKSYSAGSVSHLQQGQIAITNGVNVQWNNGVMTADSAEVMDYHGSTSITVNGLRADGREFSVGRAEAVQAGCFLVADVENARFSLGSTVKMTTSGNGKVVYDEDAAIDFKALQPNSSLTGSMTNCRKPTYAVQAMQLVVHKLNITDIINGTGTVEVDPAFGVVCVNLTPVSTYDLDFGGYENDFGFFVKEYAYKICVQKSIAQKLAADCALCGLVDLLSNKIILNGVIEYRRYWLDSALIEKEKQRAFRSLGWGKNVLDFGNGEVMIEQDAPGIGTHVSNYLELHEHDAGGVTHRFLGVNEKVERVARNWVRQYSAAYAPATTTIVDNHFDYQRGNCHVAVLPPNSPQVNAVLSAIGEQGVRYR